ncbi:hypothetical protein LF65_01185 [Clostridium beijerinckii]|uniref:Uncharacterized protein n=1 Tax=Clostridium beijerinckii TaxID=1520 RepID=A0A0B5Q6H9_CLOBE|nr:hypothetical protein [Clostridium beijerinckii]AJG97799.1 hypothetical protein LF65_01185 [Clostridium beijerinckii]
MNISICKWYNNADSPVLFFVDDFANVWIDTNGNGKIDLEEDWGYAKNGENSSFKFLNEVILKEFPNVKTTFFVPVGIRAGIIENSKIRSISKMINCDEETKNFFKNVNDNPKYEIAYHGTTHGKVGKTRYDFKQEWELFESVEEAIEIINKGKEIYKDVFEMYPKGGKYCGYTSNEFSDESIDRTGFLWWSRYWNRGIIDNQNSNISGQDRNSLSNFDIKTFGNNNVVDIPSTVNGGLFTGKLNPNLKSIKGIIKKILQPYLINKRLIELEYLIRNNLVISIQEHIAPSRDDGRRQTPNIFDDKESLIYIFNYLKNKNVWYCTGSELAEYYILRNSIKIRKTDNNNFEIKYNTKIQLSKMVLSIKLNKNNATIIEPGGRKVTGINGIYNINIADGLYEIEETL